MKWFSLIPLISTLISFAEGLITGEKKGAEKKEFVREGLKAVVNEGAALAHHEKDVANWDAIEPLADQVIDTMVEVKFPKKKFSDTEVSE